MRNYTLHIEVKIKAPESESAISAVKEHLKKICDHVRVVSLTDEGGETTYIEKPY